MPALWVNRKVAKADRALSPPPCRVARSASVEALGPRSPARPLGTKALNQSGSVEVIQNPTARPSSRSAAPTRVSRPSARAAAGQSKNRPIRVHRLERTP